MKYTVLAITLIITASLLIKLGTVSPPRAQWDAQLNRFNCSANTSRWTDNTGVYCTQDSHTGEDSLVNSEPVR